MISARPQKRIPPTRKHPSIGSSASIGSQRLTLTITTLRLILVLPAQRIQNVESPGAFSRSLLLFKRGGMLF
ncbi:hypothetical protein XPA_007195 [Xanthoria parietina]